MEHMEQNGTSEEGNTKTSSHATKEKKTYKKYRRWTITINNYQSDDRKEIIKIIGTKTQYILAHETGEKGTPHIQGYIEFKNPRTFSGMQKLFPRAHIEVAKGNKKDNFKYCSKDGDYLTNINLETFKQRVINSILKKYENITWKPWQTKVLNLIAENGEDTRTINWFWEQKGNTGKSFICKYIACKYDVVICEGKKNDIFNQVNIMLEAEKLPKVVILDIPRTNINYINYGAIEQLKNGLLYSGKYEGGVCIFPSPIVIAFANEAPDRRALSEDRWNIIEIEE